MPNIIDYVEDYGRYSFAEKPFNEVDSLVLCQLAYLRMDSAACEPQEDSCGKPLAQVLREGRLSEIFAHVFDAESTKMLCLGVISSKRYQNTLITYYTDKLDPQQELQFSAVTFLVDDLFTYVAFRGTDQSIVGWKEDFNMLFMDHVPSQLEAAAYLARVGELIDGPLIVGGHSKGGNLALYASSQCAPSIKDRIERIYNHDGPGFRDDFAKTEEYASIAARVHKTLPRTAMIGLLFSQNEEYHVVESSAFGIYQHDPFNWLVQEDKFKYVYGIDAQAVLLSEVMFKWLEKVDEEKRKKLIEAIYKIVASTEANNLQDMKENWQKSAVALMKAARDLDAPTFKFVKDTLGMLIPLSYKTAREIPLLKPKCFYCGNKMYYTKLLHKGGTHAFYCTGCGRVFTERSGAEPQALSDKHNLE